MTAVAPARSLPTLGQCPAATAYGDHLRRKGLLGVVPVVSPAVEVAEGEREVRRAVVQALRP